MTIGSYTRLLACALVSTGLVLAAIHSRWWLLLPAFVVLSLVQSRYTGFCPAQILMLRLGLGGASGARGTNSRSLPTNPLQMNAIKTIGALFAPSGQAKPAACVDRIRDGTALLVDIREPREWEGGVARSAALLPLSDLKGARLKWKAFLADVGDRKVLLYCAAGARAALAASILNAEGISAANTGGFGDWVKAGWPVDKVPLGEN
jgi:rhodanese-related sulfurtransferase